MRRLLALLFCFSVTFPVAAPARADEGMWTLDAFPAAAVRAAYHVDVTPAMLDRIRLASVRLPGCSASFVSAAGLVLTNHHCTRGCIAAASTPQKNYIEVPFVAQTRDEEFKCPGTFADSLVAIRHVTAQVNAAVGSAGGAQFNAKLRAVRAKLEADCSTPDTRCQLVRLYEGAIDDLYVYKRYTDVRLVFAPEQAISDLGGDPDNFTYPRYDLDAALLRVYADGRPLTPPASFAWSPNGTTAGQFVMIPGNPGRTSRIDTVAQLDVVRRLLPQQIALLSENHGMLVQFASESAEHARYANNGILGVENQLKVLKGQLAALNDPDFMAKKAMQERALRAAVEANPNLRRTYGATWDAIVRANRALDPIRTPFAWRELQGAPGVLGTARTLLRAAAQRQLPDGARLPEYSEANVGPLAARLASRQPFLSDLNLAIMTLTLTKIRQNLGPDDPYVRALLGNDSPAVLAKRLVSGSKLTDPDVRVALFAGGAAAVAASDDPAIVLMRTVDALALDVRKRWDDTNATIVLADAQVGRAQYAVYGTKVPPDATFTLRVTYGTVAGYRQDGIAIAPYTTVGGTFAHATGSDPFALPPSWLAAKGALDPTIPMNFVSTTDIIGGNSGSPVVDAQLRVVGTAFDGDIQSLAGDFLYDGTQNRAVAVDSRAIIAALRTVYHADGIARELQP